MFECLEEFVNEFGLITLHRMRTSTIRDLEDLGHSDGPYRMLLRRVGDLECLFMRVGLIVSWISHVRQSPITPKWVALAIYTANLFFYIDLGDGIYPSQ